MNTIHFFEKYSVEMIQNPKISIPQYSTEGLIQECTALSQSSFASQDISENDVSRHILDSSTTIIARDDSNRLCGFGSSVIKKIEDFYVIYFQSIVISNDHKRTGLRRIFLPLRIIEGINIIKSINEGVDEGHILLGGRTQNPLVYRTTNQKLGLFPNPDGTINGQIKSIGRKFAKHLYDEDCQYSPSENPFRFDDERFVAKSAYKFAASDTEGEVNLYNDGIPFCNDPHIDNYMKENVDWKNGDALILLGYYRNDKVKRLLMDSKDIISHFYSTKDQLKADIAF